MTPPTLASVCEFIVDCLHVTAPVEPAGIPLIRTPNIGKGRLELDGVFRVSERTYETWTRRAVPTTGDLILAREAPAGNVAIVKEGQRVCLGQRTVHLRPDRAKIDPDFLCYYLLAPRQQGRLLAGETGATSKHVNMKDIRALTLEGLPPLAVQAATGAALAAYDDLIENNRRRMVLLEDAVRHIYQEWFVRLRFPGREHTRVVAGVPSGWRLSNLGACSTFLSGGTPSKARSDFWEGEIPWVSSGELTALRIDDATLHVTEQAVEEGSRLVPTGTILCVVRGMSLAKEFRLAMTGRPVSFNQDLKAIIAKSEVHRDYLFHALVAQRNAIRNRAGEASHGTKKLETPVLAATPILVPPRPLQDAFAEVVGPMNEQWDNLNRQIRLLRSARDLLLPRLMSGEVAAMRSPP